MAISFSVDLSRGYLYRPTGQGKNVVLRKIDRFDVVHCLQALGYHNLNERSLNRRAAVFIPSLEEDITKFTIGVPSDAQVRIRGIGKCSQRLLITFVY